MDNVMLAGPDNEHVPTLSRTIQEGILVTVIVVIVRPVSLVPLLA